MKTIVLAVDSDGTVVVVAHREGELVKAIRCGDLFDALITVAGKFTEQDLVACRVGHDRGMQGVGDTWLAKVARSVELGKQRARESQEKSDAEADLKGWEL